jgi:uncharacterized protein (DUF1330 family)
MKMRNYKIAAAVIGSFVLGVGTASVLAQGTAPHYEVAEINVKDQTGYEASGVDKVRDAIKANGGKFIAGGYDKAKARTGAAVANRFLIVQYPSKGAADKTWTTIKEWWDTAGSKHAADSGTSKSKASSRNNESWRWAARAARRFATDSRVKQTIGPAGAPLLGSEDGSAGPKSTAFRTPRRGGMR